MELKNVRRSIIINGYKFTPKTIKACNLVYIGSAKECEAYAEKIDNDDNTDSVFIGCLSNYDMSEKGMKFRGAGNINKKLQGVYFVQYYG